MPERLKPPPFPSLLDYLWEWYKQISEGRTGGGFGISHLSWLDLNAWCTMTGTKLNPWEAKAMIEIDTLFVRSRLKKK